MKMELPTTQADFRKLIKKYSDLANFLRDVHSRMHQTLKGWGRAFHIAITIGAFFSAVLALADYSYLSRFTGIKADNFGFILGVFVSLVFVLVILNEVFGFQKRAESHRKGIEELTGFMKKLDILVKVELANFPPDEILRRSREIKEDYLNITSSLELIPHNCFLRLKRSHKQKVAISIALGKSPFKSIREIKKELKQSDQSD